MVEPLQLRGLVVATPTPMQADGSVDFEVLPRLFDHLQRNSIAGVYVNGSSGEGLLLTDEERMQVVERIVEVTAGRFPVIVQIGHGSWRAAARLAEHAERVGAAAISATPPGYFTSRDEQGLVEGLSEVVAAAPRLPFYYYHIPALSGVHIDPIRFTSLALDRLPTFVGIKYSDGGSLYRLPQLLAIDEGLEILSGSDEAYLDSLAIGYRAAVGSTYAWAAPLYHMVAACFGDGDLPGARLWQHRALRMIDACLKTCGRAGLKAMMEMVGIDCGPVRRPIDPATQVQRDELRAELDLMGFPSWLDEAGQKKEAGTNP